MIISERRVAPVDIPVMLCDLPGCTNRVDVGGDHDHPRWYQTGWVKVQLQHGSTLLDDKQFCGYEHLSAWAEVKAIAVAVADAPPMEPAG